MLEASSLPVARVSTKGCRHSGMGESEVKPQPPRSGAGTGGGAGGGAGQASVARMTEPSAHVCVAAGGGGGGGGGAIGGGSGGGGAELPPNAKRTPAVYRAKPGDTKVTLFLWRMCPRRLEPVRLMPSTNAVMPFMNS